MSISPETKQKIYQAHIVNGIDPDDYKVIYKNFFELLQYRVHLHPDRVYIASYDDDEKRLQLSYKEFAEKVFKTANLLAQNGIGIEDRIATVSYNHINTVIQYFAAWVLGATVVPINVNEEAELIKYILESSGAKLAFVKYEYVDKIAAIRDELTALDKIFVHGLDEHRTESAVIEKLYSVLVYEDEIEKYKAEFAPNEKVNQETEALIVYTSGTTGLPKGVVLTQYNLLIDADGITKWHEMSAGDKMMCVLPIHHVNGTVVSLITPMFYGGTTILNRKFHTHNFFQRLANEKVQIVSVVPTLLQFLCHDYETGNDKDFFHAFEDQIASTFKHIICGAGPLTCELVSKFESLFGLKIVHGYGLSETTCYSCFIPVNLSGNEHGKWLNDFGFPSIGVPIEPNEMHIQNEFGNSVGENNRGEIVIRGHNVMKYYLTPPFTKGGQGGSESDTNVKTFEFGWFRSGDEGFYKCDEKGNKYFFITGRIKELIIRGGVNIAPLEIDEVLMSLPMVKAGIAVGFENEWYGEEVGALVLLKQGIYNSDSESSLKNEIIASCREKLPFFKAPKTVIFSDSIPVTSTGKYQRNKVRHLFEEFKSMQFKE